MTQEVTFVSLPCKTLKEMRVKDTGYVCAFVYLCVCRKYVRNSFVRFIWNGLHENIEKFACQFYVYKLIIFDQNGSLFLNLLFYRLMDFLATSATEPCAVADKPHTFM